MNFIKDLKVSAKLVLLLITTMVFLSAVGWTGYHYLAKSQQSINDIYNEGLLIIEWLNENRAHSRAIEADILDLMLTSDANENKSLTQDIEERSKTVDNNLALYEKTQLDSFEMENLRILRENLQKYRESRAKVIALAMQNKNTEAYQLYNQSARKYESAFNQNLIDLANYNTKLADEVNKQNKKNFDVAITLFVSIISAGIVIVALLGWVIVRSITENLKAVTIHLGVLAKGDFSNDVPQEHLQVKNEFGVLANAFDTMQNNMRGLIRQLSQTSEQLAAAAEEMTASAQQSAQAANQVAVTITEVANGADDQLKSVDNAMVTVEHVSASIQQIVANNAVTVSTSNETAGATKDGLGAIKTAISQMNNIETTVNSSAMVVTKLGERSKEIGQIVDTISGIAGQTNLLALNAAIEAARAGEQGRGFAVVAEEVRKLAEQSQDAAKQIADLINEIQTDTDKAVNAMNDGTNEVKLGTQVVNTAGQSFNRIANLVDDLAKQGQEIATNIQQVGFGSQEIVSSIKKIDNVSKNMAGQTQTVSAATEEQSASMEEIAASSQSLAKMAEELQDAIRKFKI
jgi:methyl-accepting chemotaxis protein